MDKEINNIDEIFIIYKLRLSCKNDKTLNRRYIYEYKKDT